MRLPNFARGLFVSALALTAALVTAYTPAHAQSDYPSRPIRLIVGFAAGGGNDIFARVVAEKASQILGQPVVVENRPGAGGRLSAEYVSNQPADGYTLLVGASGAMSIAAAIYSDLKYHPTKTLAPLAMIGSFPLIMVINPDNPAKTLKEFVEWGKQHPDKMNYPATSPAFILPSEQLKLKAGMPGVMIPYKSSNEMILSVIEGQTAFCIADGPPTVPQVKAGKVRALAVTGSERSSELPDTPSMAEAGYPGVDIHLWSGIFAPIATPAPVQAKLEKGFNEAIKDPGVSAKLKTMAVDPGGIPAADFKKIVDADIGKFTDVIKAANLHLQE
ncbi:MAG TPA: tripartite tricarboxylate transporter substrate binding protein [Xanthobacteraceae bacterium]|jgi:tripartite-type tricarboxylate transporter receptor subunit TctC|nr:tripartite tricarboxylate transporter substrate binding protein [Xanthobacteraceae bacterium]